MIKKLLCFIAAVTAFTCAQAQDSYNDRAQKYIAQYYPLAMAEQTRAGVPAAVTLGQGILETEAGASELMTQANNHFGIKCKNDWQGDTFLHDDDHPQECFKKYKCADDSYKDHSDHLRRNPRYSPLFAIDQKDYAGWAKCLKKCGYATNPQYAQRLINIIEQFNLQSYTLLAMDSTKHDMPVAATNIPKPVAKPEPPKKDTAKAVIVQPVASAAKNVLYVQPASADTVRKPEVPKPATSTSFDDIKKKADSVRHIIVKEEPIAPPVVATAAPAPKPDTIPKAKPIVVADSSDVVKYDSGKIITVNGLKAFYAYKGEMLLQYAVKYNIRYPHLLEINDLPDAPLNENMLIYTERKLSSGTHARHTVKDGETMHQVAQTEGVQLRRLMVLNMMEAGEEPATGAILELQKEAAKKPALRAAGIAKKEEKPTLVRTKPTTDFVAINHTKPADTVKPQPIVLAAAPDKTQATAIVHAGGEVVPVKVTPAPQKETPQADTIKKAVAVAVDTPQQTVDSNVARPVLAIDSTLPNNPHELMKEDTSADDLDQLKRELDKVVYTDDSKLVKPQPAPKAPEAKKPEAKKPEPPKANSKNSAKYYTVKKGDTLSGIAKKNHVTVRQLMRWNDIDADDLSLGQKVRVKE